MKNPMKKLIYKSLIKLYLIIVNSRRAIHLPTSTRSEYDCSMDEFSAKINKLEYKQDQLGGLIDTIGHPDRFFDESITYNRDCDNWARIWSLWFKFKNYYSCEYVCANPTNLKTLFKSLHVVTVGRVDEDWYLLNYHNYGPFRSRENALEYLTRFPSYSDDVIVVKSLEVK